MTADTGAIEAALAANDIAGAAALAEHAVATGQKSPMLFNLLAWASEEKGDFAAAHRWLEAALALAPDDPLILAAIGSALRKENRLAEALTALDAAIAREPRLPAAWLDRGYALEAGGSIAPAEKSFRRSVTIDPGNAPGWGALASAAARLGKRGEARDAAARALAIDPGQAAAAIALARVELEERATEAAAERLRTLLADARPGLADRMMALGLLGDALDRSGDTAAAFATYGQANAAFEQLHGSAIAAVAEPQAAFVERIEREVMAIDPARWAAAPSSRRRDGVHAFLLGFPRSGTTLVENILASLPGAAALEERPTLAMADHAFLPDAGGIGRLARLDDPTPYVDAYWRAVTEAGVAPDARLFVDMDPMKGIRLPIIARLFPGAKVIVMRRDPREVVWSCFRTSFGPSGSAMAFTSLEGAAWLYDAMMRLTERCLATMPIDAHVLRYDRLVEDFDATTQALCGFLGVAWDPALRSFDKTAETRGVTTASIGQVRRGLYDGRGQWEPYATEMAAVMPILMPWVERFGFGV